MYASQLIGAEAVPHYEVARQTGANPLSAELTKMRYQLLGHILRREGSDPARAASYDRFGQPKALSGTGRWGAHAKAGQSRYSKGRPRR